MKLAHLADLHLGATLHDRERLEEQKLFLDWFCGELARETPRIDLLVVAGDVFDGHAPSPAARTVWYDFLARVRDPANPLAGAVVAIAGNHDSAPAMRCAGALARHSGIRIVADGPSLAEDEAFALECAGGGVMAVAAVPFMREARLRNEAPADSEPARAIEAGFRAHCAAAAARARAAAPSGAPLVLVAHCALGGAKASDAPDAEIRVVGNLAQIPASSLPKADYVALGHLHVPQEVPVEFGRAFYAGSPYPVGTGELGTPKSVPFVTLVGGGEAAVERRPVDASVLRPIRAFAGSTEQIVEEAQRLVREFPDPDSARNPVAAPWFTAKITDGGGSLDELQARLTEVTRGSGAEFFGLRDSRASRAAAALPSFEPATFARLDPLEVARLRFDADGASPERTRGMLDLVRQAVARAERASGAAERPETAGSKHGGGGRVAARIFSVELANLNSLKGTARIDFEAIRATGGTFVVAGNTGAGKTTVLDAITLALYGQTARQEGNAISGAANEVMSRGAPFCRAAVRFRGCDGHVYRAEWSQRRKKRASGFDSVRLVLQDETVATDSGVPKTICETHRTAEWRPTIEERFGLSYEEFTRIAMLSQGRFDQFLKADEDERAEILEKVSDTFLFSRVGASINAIKIEADAEAERQRAVSGGTRSLIEEKGDRSALDEQRMELEARAAAAGRDVARLRAELDWTRRAEALDAEAASFRTDEQGHARAKAAFVPDAARLDGARRAASLQGEWTALSLARQTAETAEGRLREIRAEIDSAVASMPDFEQSAVTAAKTLAEATRRSEERGRFLDDMDEKDREIHGVGARAKALADAAASASRSAKTADANLRRAMEQAQTAAERAAAAKRLLSDGTPPPAGLLENDQLFSEIASARDARRRIDEAAARLEPLRQAAEAAGGEHERARRAAEETDARWNEDRADLQRLEKLALLAESENARDLRAHLEEGRPCPVCGAIFSAKGDASPLAAFPPSSKYAAKIAAGEKAAAERRMGVEAAFRRWQGAEDALRRARESLEETKRRAEADLEAATSGVAAAIQDAETKAGMIGRLRQTAIAEQEEASRAALESDAENKKLAALESERKALYGDANPVVERKALNDELAKATSLASSANATLEAARNSLDASREEKTRAEAELARHREKLAEAMAQFGRRRLEAGFATDEDWRAAALPHEESDELQRRERQLRDEEVRLFGADGAGGEKARIARELDALARHPDRPEARRCEGEIDAALQVAELARTEADMAAGAAKRKVEELDALLAKSRGELEALERLEKAAEDWRALDAQLGGEDGKNFRLFAQRLNFGNLVAAADPFLQTMSGGRYRFAWADTTEATGTGKVRRAALRVIDAEQSGSRPVTNLSGGESFFASLALALGFSALGSGGCENLFIDEGFGALDSQTLDAAVEVLERIGSQGTLVGIVTHVEAVENAVATVVEAVRRGDSTSCLRARDGAPGVFWSDDFSLTSTGEGPILDARPARVGAKKPRKGRKQDEKQ